MDQDARAERMRTGRRVRCLEGCQGVGAHQWHRPAGGPARPPGQIVRAAIDLLPDTWR